MRRVLWPSFGLSGRGLPKYLGAVGRSLPCGVSVSSMFLVCKEKFRPMTTTTCVGVHDVLCVSVEWFELVEVMLASPFCSSGHRSESEFWACLLCVGARL